MELTVDPARAGRNQVHLYLFDRRDGAQFDRVKELRLEATLPERHLGPLELDAQKAGPGHWVVRRWTVAPAGDWRLEVSARVSAVRRLHGRARGAGAMSARSSWLVFLAPALALLCALLLGRYPGERALRGGSRGAARRGADPRPRGPAALRPGATPARRSAAGVRARGARAARRSAWPTNDPRHEGADP